MPKAFLRAQYGIQISLGKGCLQELVVALDRSKNDTFLTQILKWAEKNFACVQVNWIMSVVQLCFSDLSMHS